MKVREIIDSQVRQISSSAMLSEAVDRMQALGVRALPVVENNQIVGVVTEGDITASAAGEDADPGTTPIRDVMTADMACCSDEDDVEQAARIMENGHVRWLVVLGPDHKAVGMLSRRELASKTGQKRLPGKAPQAVCEPAPGAAGTARRR